MQSGLIDGSTAEQSGQQSGGSSTVDGPHLVFRSDAGHEITLTGDDLLLIWVMLALISGGLIAVLEAYGRA